MQHKHKLIKAQERQILIKTQERQIKTIKGLRLSRDKFYIELQQKSDVVTKLSLQSAAEVTIPIYVYVPWLEMWRTTRG